MIIWNISPPILHAYERMKLQEKKEALLKRKGILKKRRERFRKTQMLYNAFLLKNLLKKQESLNNYNNVSNKLSNKLLRPR